MRRNFSNRNEKKCDIIRDYGQRPLVVYIDNASRYNQSFRAAFWTGKNAQITLMSLHAGEEIGAEMHSNTDQILVITEGNAHVKIGSAPHCLNDCHRVCEGYAIVIPAGVWHNVINTGKRPLKLYSVYSPPHHPFGTVHKTRMDAECDNRH